MSEDDFMDEIESISRDARTLYGETSNREVEAIAKLIQRLADCVKAREKQYARMPLHEIGQAEQDMVAINKLIYAAGAPLGTERYFQICEIASRYEK
jgi:acyl-CoA reductase-like NAD-dependent aldehyde dehydrogenase